MGDLAVNAIPSVGFCFLFFVFSTNPVKGLCFLVGIHLVECIIWQNHEIGLRICNKLTKWVESVEAPFITLSHYPLNPSSHYHLDSNMLRDKWELPPSCAWKKRGSVDFHLRRQHPRHEGSTQAYAFVEMREGCKSGRGGGGERAGSRHGLPEVVTNSEMGLSAEW